MTTEKLQRATELHKQWEAAKALQELLAQPTTELLFCQAGQCYENSSAFPEELATPLRAAAIAAIDEKIKALSQEFADL